ncbi:response regulator transcription factor [Geobacter sulfurreducens]|uniref:Winged-helix transcriptional response regulator n=1 Tax=Geobacter sulfurreducens (strain ATCC 51573 / DSM 12127 / PCA) TaxID=243231 RepID=Q74BZ8_GEOSL|nr:response regulator transcription factor [Geobacter sulfurreducens]AAR35255.1 winged-helix transcriptional response regulator [Geobacter sulfurreducens PCA]ADI84717.1 winged-helix transcriptional response regulator [Geobacter sulfurreducens KN400]AJY68129.1 transcriptional regulator [Geobacter sulfurreducens]QVW33834.1 response regulator transcription factor [Geobacter sulfurreducens]UAC02621.1 response regulator transcription factor [Geobacter sulfurreducens]
MTEDKPHILLVEDEIHLARGICFNLEMEGYRVSHVESGEAALERLTYDRFALIILDVMLPGIDGFTVCERVRATDARVPILILTARADDGDRITGLDRGADDYLTKPFNLNEFLLRVRGMLRRSAWYRPEPVEEGYRFGDNEVFLLSYHARTAQGEVDLTELEVKMLSLFFHREGEAIPRGEILENVWGYSSDTETRTLDNFIVRLRKYFEPNPAKPVYFQTVRGVGYRFSRKGGNGE